MDTWLRTFLQPTAPEFWILLSFALWLPIKLTEKRWSERQQRWLNMARWVLVPYAGLMAGSLSPRLMGLIGIDWSLTLGIGIALTVAVLVILAIVRFSLHEEAAVEAEIALAQPAPASNRRGWASGTVTALAAGAEQFHWSFLRGAIWEMLILNQSASAIVTGSIVTTPFVTTQPGYWAVWLAALIALPEILLQPLVPAHRLIKVAILVMTSILFVFTQNFWLCWVLHVTAWMVLTTRRTF